MGPTWLHAIDGKEEMGRATCRFRVTKNYPNQVILALDLSLLKFQF